MATVAGLRSRTAFSLAALWGLQLAVLLFCAGSVAGQGLIVVPNTVTRELGGYYISKLGLAELGLNHYAILSQRNVQRNVYNWVNDISDSDTPRAAASKLSNIRGLYESHTVGGKIKVESFYRLLRCEDGNTCFVINRLIASTVSSPNGTVNALSYVKTGMGNSGWLVNAPQSIVNPFLAQPENQQTRYVDPVYGTQLFYKTATPPPPCRCVLLGDNVRSWYPTFFHFLVWFVVPLLCPCCAHVVPMLVFQTSAGPSLPSYLPSTTTLRFASLQRMSLQGNGGRTACLHRSVPSDLLQVSYPVNTC